MANGAAQIEPLDLAVGGGTVHLAPRVAAYARIRWS